ncbi:hypothetical protein ACMFMG_002739 [Clarireedia jacksonii]
MGVFQVATDTVILGLPIYSLWHLKMRSKKKLGLVGIFVIAFLTTLVGIVRLANLTTVKLKENLTGTMVWADFLTTLEPNLAILCVSLPMLAGVFKDWFGHGDRSTIMNYSNKAYGVGDPQHSNRQKFKKMDDSILMETVVDVRNETISQEELMQAPSSMGFEESKKTQPWK